MKPLATSAVLHALVLTWGLWTFGSPPPLDLTQGEALPVSIVPIEEYSQATMGEEDAPMAETSAPTPTEAPEETPMPAENVGENEVDLAAPPRPVAAPRDTVQTATAEAPPPAPETPPVPEPEAEAPPVPEEPAPVQEAAPEPQPEPVQEAALPPEPTPEPEPTPALPQNVPVPQVRPQPPVQQARPTPSETRPTEARPTQTANDSEPEFDADDIAALLNREQSAGGGARRSEQQAALGASRTTGAKLSQSELDALRSQVQRCWSPPAGVSDAGSLRVSIAMQLDQTGQLIGMPQIVDGGAGSTAQRVAGEAAVRAVRRCAPYNLPSDKYDTWKNVTFNFDPSQMF